MREIDVIYKQLCNNLYKFGRKVGNTKEIRNIAIQLDDITENIVSIRNISPSYLFGEWLWYFTGRNDVKFIGEFGSLWKKLSDDGITNNSAYGYLMKYAFGFDQIEKIIELLKKDPNSRRAIINLNTPNPNLIETKDEPCTIALQYCIRDNKLYSTTVMRSNDIWYGFPYDVAFFTELQMYIADKLDVAYGSYTHFVMSLHVYDKDINKIYEVMSNPISKEIKFDRLKLRENLETVTKEIESDIDKGINVKEKILELASKYFSFNEEVVCFIGSD